MANSGMEAPVSHSDTRWLPAPAKVILAALLIGCAPNIARFGIDLGPGALGPQAIVFWRFAFAAPVVLAILLVRDRKWPAPPGRALTFAAACFALDLALWHWAIDYTTVANSSFLVSMGNLCLGLTAWAVLGERPQAAWFVALPFAIGGAFLLSQGGDGGLLGASNASDVPQGARSPDWRGDLLALGAAICASLYLLGSKIARTRRDGITTIFWLCAMGAIVAAIIVIISGETFLPANWRFFAVPLALALLVQVLGQGLLVAALGEMPGARVALLFLLQPVTAAAISVLWFGEMPAPLQFVGAAAILLAIGWVGSRPPAAPLAQKR